MNWQKTHCSADITCAPNEEVVEILQAISMVTSSSSAERSNIAVRVIANNQDLYLPNALLMMGVRVKRAAAAARVG